ncbi:MAG: head GIN domain-containing protein [Crocinitomicaceae bacterium]|nr:DUF2807 domain-containing protein [Crocinitomicaceae bacterium]
MKNILTLALLVLSTQVFAGEFEKDLDAFTTVKANGNFKLFLTKGDKHHVKVENNEPEITDDQVEITVQGGNLDVKIKGNTFKKLELKIYITYEKVLNIDASGGAWIKCESPLEGDEIDLSVRTDGIISAELSCDKVNASIITGKDIRLRGKVGIANLKVSTGGFISAVDLHADEVIAKVSTGGDISCWGSKKMDLKVNTGGTIKYKYDGENESSNVQQKTVIAGNIEKLESK